ncbi:unnamed protein product, partial [Acanthocheilonema viteae]
TWEEKERLHGYVLNRAGGVEANMSQILGQKLYGSIPNSVDYRRIVGTVPVVNQGKCGICFIFTALATLEMYIALRNKQNIVKLSVQDIVDCSDLQGCDGKGGSSSQVFDWIADHGVTTDRNYPYKERDSYSCPIKANQRIKGGLVGSILLPFDNEEIIKRVLAVYGPVSVSLHATKSSFQNYASGK